MTDGVRPGDDPPRSRRLAAAGPVVLLAQAQDPEVVHRTVAEVLSQADYQGPGGPSLIDRGIAFLLEQLGRFLLQFDSDGGTGSLLAAVTLVLIILALVIALGMFLRRLRRGTALDTVVEGPVGRPARAWALEAEDHERAGELRQALRCRYRETVARLAAAQLIDEIPGRTTGEYARAVQAAIPAAAPQFAALTTRFEDTWYGGRDVDPPMLAAVRGDQAQIARAARLGRESRRTPDAASVGGG
ncbi:MAG TPA: DUF4129 domain-containing protein [Euzebya sp.]|nr:DUF4129 domain-containing protein [Euzebya sp.]